MSSTSLDYTPDWERISKCGGYFSVFCPDHPRAWSTGYVHVHIIITEIKAGRLLTKSEVVHHIDRDKLNNSPDNLEILPSRTEHAIEHGNDRQITKVELTCHSCGTQFTRRLGNEPSKKGYKNAFCSRKCNGKTNGRPNFLPRSTNKIEHGSKVAYSYHKCRCELCRSENTRRHKIWRDSKLTL